MRRRGLTMIELLLALALLAGIVSAATAWIRTSMHMSAAATTAQREVIIESVLTLIGEDLVIGDFDHRDGAGHAVDRPPRVRVEGTGSGGASETIGEIGKEGRNLEIDVRQGITHIYRMERLGPDSKSHLVRVERRGSESLTRPLLHEASEFRCVLNEQQRLLEVTIKVRRPSTESGDSNLESRSMTRRFHLR